MPCPIRHHVREISRNGPPVSALLVTCGRIIPTRAETQYCPATLAALDHDPLAEGFGCWRKLARRRGAGMAEPKRLLPVFASKVHLGIPVAIYARVSINPRASSIRLSHKLPTWAQWSSISSIERPYTCSTKEC
jgi:hypothetical protein